jgi:hypothetical protein
VELVVQRPTLYRQQHLMLGGEPAHRLVLLGELFGVHAGLGLRQRERPA